MPYSAKHLHGCLPVTALKEVHLGSFTYLLQGQGPFVSLLGTQTGASLFKLRVFRRNNVHGFMIDEPRCLKQEDQVTVLVWGGSSLRTIHVLRKENESCQPQLICGTLEHAAPDWIYDACPSAVSDSLSMAYLITGHNAVLSVGLRQISDADTKYSKAITLTRLISGVKSTLYAGHILALSPSHILVAAGTVFGEIIVWSCFRHAHHADSKPTVTASIHHFFTGHDGSIFGVSISDEMRVLKDGKEHRVRLLASCSDDRTVRIWDVSDCNHVTSTDRPAYVTDGFDLRSTGFGSTAPASITSGSEAAVASGWGHASRVWGVYFLPTTTTTTTEFVKTVSLVSRGEDATSQLWHLDMTLSDSDLSLQCNLSNVTTLTHHAGKHIWSLAVSRTSSNSQLVYTGGNDGAVRTFELSIKEEDDSRSVYCSDILLKSAVSRIDTADRVPRTFAFVSEKSFLVIYTSGLVQLGTLFTDTKVNKPYISWETLLTVQDMRSFATISSLATQGLALICGSSGTLYLYRHSTKTLTELVKLPYRAVKSFMLDAKPGEAADSQTIRFLIVYPQIEEAHLFHIDLTGGNIEVKQTSLALYPGLTISSASVVKGGKCLAVGGIAGQLLLYCLESTKEKLEYSFISWRAHGRDPVDSILSLDHEGDSHSSYVMTGGTDGHYNLYRIRERSDDDNANDGHTLQHIHRSSAPLTQIKGSFFYPQTKHLMLYGFRSSTFIFWNENTQTQIFTLDCGGVNRVWRFMPDMSCPGAGTIVWIQARALHVVIAKPALHCPLRLGNHGREIKALTIRETGQRKDGQSFPLIASGGEDTTIRISTMSPVPTSGSGDSWDSIKTLRIMKDHVSGLQQLRWSDDGRFLFSSAAAQELMARRIRSVPMFGVAALMEAACPPEDVGMDLRITSFDVLRLESGADEDKFLLALVYSNSTIKIFSYTSSNDGGSYELLGRGTYSTNCLTQVHFLIRSSTVVLVTGATDGYLAFWPVPWITQVGCGRFSTDMDSATHNQLTWTVHHAVHTSSVKTLEHQEILPGWQLLLSGGDDNSLSVTLIEVSPDVCVVSSVRVVNAHASAITATKILGSRADTTTTTTTTATAEVVSSGNDQRVKFWTITANIEKLDSPRQLLRVALKSDQYSPVADIADVDDMEILQGADSVPTRVLVLGGVGTETLRLV